MGSLSSKILLRFEMYDNQNAERQSGDTQNTEREHADIQLLSERLERQ